MKDPKKSEQMMTTFIKHLEATNSLLAASAGSATIYEACIRLLVLEEFDAWRKQIEEYKPALAVSDKEPK